MSEGIDLIKIIKNKELIAVLNLNNMIPILNNNIKELKYKDIEKYRNFETEAAKEKYIAFLSMELDLINDKINKIKNNALKLYNEKINNPNSKVAKRSCNFKLLEEKCKEF